MAGSAGVDPVTIQVCLMNLAHFNIRAVSDAAYEQVDGFECPGGYASRRRMWVWVWVIKIQMSCCFREMGYDCCLPLWAMASRARAMTYQSLFKKYHVTNTCVSMDDRALVLEHAHASRRNLDGPEPFR